MTYRLAPHGAADFFEKYRTEKEVAQWRERDPIDTLERRLLEAEALEADMIDEIKSGVRDEVEKAIEFAAASEQPSEEELYTDVSRAATSTWGTGRCLRQDYREALREAIVHELDRDESVVLIGEDIGVYGGTQLITVDLLERYGAKRAIHTPICEGGFTGAAIGMAMMGLRPIVEMMTMNFSFLAVDQIIQNAAKSAISPAVRSRFRW